MTSLPDDSEINQLLDQIEDVEEQEQTNILKNFFRKSILEDVQDKFEQLMKAERSAFLEEAEEENGGKGYYSRDPVSKTASEPRHR